MAALETTAREVTGQPSPTLGKLVPMLDLPAALDQAVDKLWGYASDRRRHIREQESVDHSEAELAQGGSYISSSTVPCAHDEGRVPMVVAVETISICAGRRSSRSGCAAGCRTPGTA